MLQSESINELAAALAKAQGRIKGALKDTSNPFFKSKYADLASVWEACRSALSENGLSVVQTTTCDNPESVTVETQLIHSSGQWIRGCLTMRPAKSDPQGIGSTITYARRYGLAAIVGVAPEDDDGNAASGQMVTPDPVDDARIARAAKWFIDKIDSDTSDKTDDERAEITSDIRTQYDRLSNNERIALDALLREKAKDSNRSYKNILKVYLNRSTT